MGSAPLCRQNRPRSHHNSLCRQNRPRNLYGRQNRPRNLYGRQNRPRNLHGRQNRPRNLYGRQNRPRSHHNSLCRQNRPRNLYGRQNRPRNLHGRQNRPRNLHGRQNRPRSHHNSLCRQNRPRNLYGRQNRPRSHHNSLCRQNRPRNLYGRQNRPRSHHNSLCRQNRPRNLYGRQNRPRSHHNSLCRQNRPRNLHGRQKLIRITSQVVARASISTGTSSGELDLSGDAGQVEEIMSRVREDRASHQDFSRLGGLLFARLFNGGLRELFAANRFNQDASRMRLMMQLIGEPMRALPWELMLQSGGSLLGGSPQTPMSRYVDARLRDTEPIERGLRVLVAIAEPSDEPGVGATVEMRALDSAEPITSVSGLDVTVERSITRARLHELLRRHRPDVVHLICHGTPMGTPPGLLLEDGSGHTDRVSAEDVVQILSSHAGVRLAVLSACASEPTAYAIARQGIASLGMLWDVSLSCGADPARLFYTHLYQREELDRVVNATRSDMRQSGRAHSSGWAAPVLYLPRGRADGLAQPPEDRLGQARGRGARDRDGVAAGVARRDPRAAADDDLRDPRIRHPRLRHARLRHPRDGDARLDGDGVGPRRRAGHPAHRDRRGRVGDPAGHQRQRRAGRPGAPARGFHAFGRTDRDALGRVGPRLAGLDHAVARHPVHGRAGPVARGQDRHLRRTADRTECVGGSH